MRNYQTNISAIDAKALDLATKELADKMRNQPITVSKDFRLGNMAKNAVNLDNLGMPGYMLFLTTCKRSNRQVTASARVDVAEGGFMTHRMFQDFNKQVAASTKMANVGTVRAVHQEAMNQIGFILAEVVAHYLSMEVAAEPA